MMVRLRGHHLVCLHFFTGEGLGPVFAANYRRVLDRLAGGEAVARVAGADDVCAACPHSEGGRCGWDEAEVRELDRRAESTLGTAPAAGWAELAVRVRSLSPAWWAEFCAGCAWARYCWRAGGEYSGERE